MRSLEQQVAAALTSSKLSIACAESCTGGLLTGVLTAVSGSSAYLQGAVIAYANEVKESFLGVQSRTLAQYGAVSAETAREMASGIRKRMNTDIGVSVTGLAGPEGGTAYKPVGLVYIAVSGNQGTRIIEKIFQGSRSDIRQQAVEAALTMVLDYISSL